MRGGIQAKPFSNEIVCKAEQSYPEGHKTTGTAEGIFTTTP